MKHVTKDFAVRREVLEKFFEPPIGKSTFHDLVARGKIAELEELRGFYRLNESLHRLGLPQVEEIPRGSTGALDKLALADIALHLCMPDELPAPSAVLEHALTADEVLEVVSLQRAYSQQLSAIHIPAERLKFAQGVRDAAVMLRKE